MSFVNGSTVNIGWLGPTTGDQPASYVIEAGSAPGLSNILIFDTGSTAAGFQATSVPANTYFVRVRARNAAGLSGPSNEVTIVVSGGGPGPCTGAPGAPTNLTASTNGSTVTLFWNAPSGSCAPTTYAVEAGSSPGANNLANILTGNASTSFTASNVPAGTYYVRVRAGNGNTIGGVSNDATVIVTSSGRVTLTIFPATLPPLTVGVPISIALSVVGGTGVGLIFSPNNIGSQIPGLTINTPSPGLLSGTPTTAGPYLRGFSVTDSAGNTGSITYSGTVNSP
jgi:large repetitive protein